MLKQSATYAQQIAKLREHGCIVTDEVFCEKVLSRVSYYRLSAYFLTFRKKDKSYMPGTDFNRVYKLYEFDRKLRRLLFAVIDELEVYLRAQLSYLHTHKYGPDGYMNAVNFGARHDHLGFVSRINDAVKSNDKLPFVKHHINNYGGRFPLWVIAELFTFGMLSYFYTDMISTDQKFLARNIFNTSVQNTKSWLYCCTNLRNVCAHSRRLYNSVFSVIPANIPQVDKSAERKLFAAIMAVRELYPDTEKWNGEFMSAMSALFDEYSDIVLLRFIGFPKDWENIMKK
jgi:abortive infection bacteriophage resistance protein